MPYLREAAKIAARLHQELGPEALSFVSARVEEARRASDKVGVTLWNGVARRLAVVDQRDHAAAGGNGTASSWRLMQSVEYCRHRAMDAEKSAAVAPEALREGLIKLAVQWRDLALHAHLLARFSKKPARAELPVRFGSAAGQSLPNRDLCGDLEFDNRARLPERDGAQLPT